MNINRRNWTIAFVLGMAIVSVSGSTHARDRGFNQPGRVGGVAGIGAPAGGLRDPGINQPGAAGNVGVSRPGVGAPGAGAWDPGVNQPGAIGNTGPVRREMREEAIEDRYD